MRMSRDRLLAGVSKHRRSKSCEAIDFSREAFLLAEMDGADYSASAVPSAPISEKDRFSMRTKYSIFGLALTL